MDVTQWVIAVFGFMSIYMTQQRNEFLKRVAWVPGLVSQPFFLFETYSTQQWGMFLLSLFYTYAWALGAYHYLRAQSEPEENGEGEVL